MVGATIRGAAIVQDSGANMTNFIQKHENQCVARPAGQPLNDAKKPLVIDALNEKALTPSAK